MTSYNGQELHFEERNSLGTDTILFLHGGGSCGVEWDLVANDVSLASYHLILVDLPHHSGSRHLAPFSLPAAADAVVDTIAKHAQDGKAHIVGLSLGGFVALDLTARHPEVVLSCFVTGAVPWQGLYRWFGERPNLVWWVGRLQSAVPGLDRWAERAQGLMISPALRAKLEENKCKILCLEVFHAITNQFGWDTVERVADSGVRTCAVAGSKMDQVAAVKKMGLMLRNGGKKKGITNMAVEVKEAVHWWNIQLPALFASGINAWVREEQLPREFKSL
ncbi:hypothetical protein TruAng_002884 [Truncatella angustata]|nr:hypothetical protein TruAng_002884 [Truncatella angustata]